MGVTRTVSDACTAGEAIGQGALALESLGCPACNCGLNDAPGIAESVQARKIEVRPFSA
jgi:hypothetical protein